MKIIKWFEIIAVLSAVVAFYVYIYRKVQSEIREEIQTVKKMIRRAHKFDIREVVVSEVARRRSAECSLHMGALTSVRSLKLKILLRKAEELKPWIRPELNCTVAYDRTLESLEIKLGDILCHINASVYYRKKILLFWYFRRRKRDTLLRLSHKGDVIFESEDAYLVFKMLVRFLLHHFPPEVLLHEHELPLVPDCLPK